MQTITPTHESGRETIVAEECVEQALDSYSAADHQVWGKLFRRQAILVQKYGCREYLDGLALLDLPQDQVASLDAINRAIRNRCEWQFIPASGILDNSIFFRHIQAHRFPITVDMRKPEEIEFSELPDLFHDLFGHGPLLFNPKISELYDAFAAVAIQRIDDEEFLARMGSLFWYAFEVGLIRQDGERKAYGGAILSSAGEMRNIFESNVPIHELGLERVLAIGYEKRELQKEYFVIDSFDEIFECLDALERSYAVV